MKNVSMPFDICTTLSVWGCKGRRSNAKLLRFKRSIPDEADDKSSNKNVTIIAKLTNKSNNIESVSSY